MATRMQRSRSSSWTAFSLFLVVVGTVRSLMCNFGSEFFFLLEFMFEDISKII